MRFVCVCVCVCVCVLCAVIRDPWLKVWECNRSLERQVSIKNRHASFSPVLWHLNKTKKSFAITARDIPVDKMFLFCRTVFCLLIFALMNVKGISGYGMYSDNVTNKALMKLEDLFIISNDTFYSCSSVPWI